MERGETMKRHANWSWFGCLFSAAALFLASAALTAQEPAAAPDDAAASAPAAGDVAASAPAADGAANDLALNQRQIREKFQRLEEVLQRMAELTAANDPQRAALLRKALQQGKDDLILTQMERLVELLGE